MFYQFYNAENLINLNNLIEINRCRNKQQKSKDAKIYKS